MLSDKTNRLINGFASCLYNEKLITEDELKHILGLSTEKPKHHELITIQRAMKILKISRPTLWRWEKQGFLEPVYVGKKIRFRLSDIERLSKGEA